MLIRFYIIYITWFILHVLREFKFCTNTVNHPPRKKNHPRHNILHTTLRPIREWIQIFQNFAQDQFWMLLQSPNNIWSWNYSTDPLYQCYQRIFTQCWTWVLVCVKQILHCLIFHWIFMGIKKYQKVKKNEKNSVCQL